MDVPESNAGLPGSLAWKIGDFIIEPQLNELRGEDGTERLEPMCVNILVHLIEAAPRVVSATELLEKFWPQTFAEESNIHRRITKIRRALGDNARAPTYIETLSKRGYRVVAPVERIEPGVSTTVTGAMAPPEVDTEPPLETVAKQDQPSQPRLIYAAAALAMVIAIATVFYVFSPTEVPPPAPVAVEQPDPPRLAVLPFSTFQPDDAHRYLADGFQEDILSSLATRGIEVISRTSTAQYASPATTPTIGEIGSALNVSHVLEGSVRRENNELRIVVQLIEVAEDRSLWSETYDRPMNELFAIQREVSQSVAGQIGDALSFDEEAPTSRVPTTDIDAYDLLLQARSLLRSRSKDNLDLAESLLEEARRLDPNLAEAHASLAETLLLQTFSGKEWADVRDRALTASDESLALDPDSWWAHYVRGHIEQAWESRIDSARTHFKRALEISPDNPWLLTNYATWLVVAEAEPALALPLLERARELDPLSPGVHYGLGRALIDLGRMEEASAIIESGLDYAPANLSMNELNASLQFGLGRTFEHFRATLRLVELDPANAETLGNLASLLCVFGECDAGSLWLKRLASNTPTHYFLFVAQRNVLLMRDDGDGLARLADRFESMNSERRTLNFYDGAAIPFAAATRAIATTLRANTALLGYNKENLSVALRRSAIAQSEPFLVNESGDPVVSIEGIVNAFFHAMNLIMLDRREEATPFLEAILDYNDSYSEVLEVRVSAMLLLRRYDQALQLAEQKRDFMKDTNGLVRLRRFGLLDDLPDQARFDNLLVTIEDRNAALRDRLRAELPSLMDATHGL